MKAILSVCIFCFLGCATNNKNKSPKIVYPPELIAVEKQIKSRQYKDARGFLDTYINRSENLKYFGHAYFLKGYIFELEGNLAETIKFYRRSIQHSNKFDSLVQAKALYNLSFTLERQGAFDQLMPVLADLINRPQHFRALTAQVETRARMGAALASHGQQDQAAAVHHEAEKNYRKMSRSNWFRPTALALTKSLYYLGVAVYDENGETFDSLESKLNLGEIYLLACAEASIGSWSQKGTQKLLESYKRMWTYIESHKPDKKGLDTKAFQRQKQDVQLDRASRFYDLLAKIRPEEFPLHKVNRNSKKIIDASDAWMRKLETFALSLDLGPEMIRNQKVRQRPLVRIVDDEWKRRSTRVNKEQATEEALKPPVGAGVAVGGGLGPTTEDQKKLSESVTKETKKQFVPLPPKKDPNL